MKLNEISPDTFVKHQENGVGRIVDVEPEGTQVVLHYLSNPDAPVTLSKATAMASLDTLPKEGLEASFYNNPDQVLSWVDDGPLRLIGATLADLGGSGKSGDLQKCLEGRIVRDVTWKTWWDRVRPVAKDSGYFHIEPAKPIAIISEIADIPIEPLPRAKPRPASKSKPKSERESSSRPGATQALPAWIKWLWAKEDTPLPGTTPPDGLAALVENCPEEIIERTMARLLAGAAESLAASRLTPKARDQWLELATKAYQRRQTCLGQQPAGTSARQSPQVIAQLMHAIQQRERIATLLAEVSRLASLDPRWRQDFAASLWESIKSDRSAAEELLRMLPAHLDAAQRAILWGDLAASAFATPPYPNRNSLLNRALSWLRAERHSSLRQLTLRTALGDNSKADTGLIAFISSQYTGKDAAAPERLNVLVTAALLLSEGEDNLTSEVSAAYHDAIEQPPAAGHNPLIAQLLTVAHRHIEGLQRQDELALAQQREEYESRLANSTARKGELERLVQGLRNEIAAKREESRLEIRRDMLFAMSETLKTLRANGADPDSLLRDVEAGLKLALQAGEAEFYGKEDELVAYDPDLHEPPENPPKGALAKGTLVRVIVPGARIPGTKTGNLVLLKARVKHQPEGQQCK